MTTLSKTSICLAAFALIACTSSANSSEYLEPLVKKISYADLNLETPAGAKVLYTRLQHAAREVCSPLDSHDPDRKNLWQTCYQTALASAVAQVNRGSVTALYLKGYEAGKG